MPSQSSRTTVGYTVNLEAKTCTCPDHLEGGFVCKHYHAATIVHQRDVLPDGTVIEQRKSITFTLIKKVTYKPAANTTSHKQLTEALHIRMTFPTTKAHNLPERERDPGAVL